MGNYFTKLDDVFTDHHEISALKLVMILLCLFLFSIFRNLSKVEYSQTHNKVYANNIA